MRKYPKYKETEVIWVKSLPDNWEELRVKYFSVFRNGYSFKGTDFYDDEKYPVVRIGDIQDGKVNLSEAKKVSKDIYEEAKKFSNKKGDILLALTGATIGKSAIYDTDEISLLNQRVAALRPNKKANIDFLKYLIEAPEFKTLIDFECYGGAQENIGKGQITSAKFPIPSLPEQHTIVRFLDYKTEQIDSFIANRQKQIELLKEQKAGIINKAVTKGINPNAKMKDSGIEWIGEVPEHWVIIKLKYIAKIYNGQDQKDVLDENGRFPIYGSGGIFGYANQFLFEGPSVLLGRKGTVDKPTLVESPFWSVDTAYYTKISKKADAHIFYYLCNQINFDFYIYGSAIPSMTARDLNEIKFPLPNIVEQKSILEFIKSETLIIDTLISKYQKQIDLMQEYRTALISQAVTGKIDVREWEPKKQQIA